MAPTSWPPPQSNAAQLDEKMYGWLYDLIDAVMLANHPLHGVQACKTSLPDTVHLQASVWN